MNIFITQKKILFLHRILSSCFIVIFVFSSVILPIQAQQLISTGVLNLPIPGTLITSSNAFAPVLIKGINIYPDDPLKFDFIIDEGSVGNGRDRSLKQEYAKLIKYFMAALTVPEDQMWVNLSPYEKDRIIPNGFGQTEMGRDLLAQDYMLKQLTASLMYPEDELGKRFWDRVYKKAQEQFGTTEIPVNTFNKIWIVPEKAVVYEHSKGAFVVRSRLKVLLEEDYVAMNENIGNAKFGLDNVGAISRNRPNDIGRKHSFAPTDNNFQMPTLKGRHADQNIGTQIIREILIPEIEREVNEGKTFANLRQIYNSVILATWYKQKLVGNGRDRSLLGQVYVDQNKTKGVNTDDPQINQKIYDQYVEAFKKGVYNYIKEDYDPVTQELIPRKYFSGGANLKTRVTTDIIQEGVASPIVEDKINQAIANSLVTTKITVSIKPIEREIVSQPKAASPIKEDNRQRMIEIVGKETVSMITEEGRKLRTILGQKFEIDFSDDINSIEDFSSEIFDQWFEFVKFVNMDGKFLKRIIFATWSEYQENIYYHGEAISVIDREGVSINGRYIDELRAFIINLELSPESNNMRGIHEFAHIIRRQYLGPFSSQRNLEEGYAHEIAKRILFKLGGAEYKEKYESEMEYSVGMIPGYDITYEEADLASDGVDSIMQKIELAKIQPKSGSIEELQNFDPRGVPYIALRDLDNNKRGIGYFKEGDFLIISDERLIKQRVVEKSILGVKAIVKDIDPEAKRMTAYFVSDDGIVQDINQIIININSPDVWKWDVQKKSFYEYEGAIKYNYNISKLRKMGLSEENFYLLLRLKIYTIQELNDVLESGLMDDDLKGDPLENIKKALGKFKVSVTPSGHSVNSPITIVPINKHVVIQTSLSQKKFEEVNAANNFISMDSNGELELRQRRSWGRGTPLEEVDKFFKLTEHVKELNENRGENTDIPIVIFETGIGKVKTLFDLAEWIDENEIDNVILFGSDPQYDEWRNYRSINFNPKHNIKVRLIFDDMRNLKKHFEINGKVLKIDFAYGYHSFNHFYKDEGFLNFLQNLKEIMKKDGELRIYPPNMRGETLASAGWNVEKPSEEKPYLKLVISAKESVASPIMTEKEAKNMANILLENNYLMKQTLSKYSLDEKKGVIVGILMDLDRLKGSLDAHLSGDAVGYTKREITTDWDVKIDRPSFNIDRFTAIVFQILSNRYVKEWHSLQAQFIEEKFFFGNDLLKFFNVGWKIFVSSVHQEKKRLFLKSILNNDKSHFVVNNREKIIEILKRPGVKRKLLDSLEEFILSKGQPGEDFIRGRDLPKVLQSRIKKGDMVTIIFHEYGKGNEVVFFDHVKENNENYSEFFDQEGKSYKIEEIYYVIHESVSSPVDENNEGRGKLQVRTEESIAAEKGGIDLNPNTIDMQLEKENGQGFVLPAATFEQIESLRNVEGFLPTIINIVPIVNLPLLLGFADDQDSEPNNTTQRKRADPADKRERYIRKETGQVSFLN